MNTTRVGLLLSLALLAGCASTGSKSPTQSFSGDLAFLRAHTEVIVLKDSSGHGQVAVVPKLQARAMTSTAAGGEGDSYGWINRELLASGEIDEHMNGYGGEDRFWIGPEGGQFSVFFEKGVSFEFENWHTPAPIDLEPWDVVTTSRNAISMRKNMQLTNYSGRTFDLRVDRDIKVIERSQAGRLLGVAPGSGVNMVAFASHNEMFNTGQDAWNKRTGLLSIWILGMFNPSPTTTIVVPFVEGPEAELGPIVNDTYFGKVPADRLVIGDGVMFFSGDGKYRSKIGLTPQRAKNVAGSYDATNKVLTIVQYNKPKDVTDYVNSMWELQEEPFAGDVVNSYNDGPATPGAEPMGPFYELETSSPAAALAPGESILHIHRTFHFQGAEDKLDPIAQATLGVTISEIKSALQ